MLLSTSYKNVKIKYQSGKIQIKIKKNDEHRGHREKIWKIRKWGNWEMGNNSTIFYSTIQLGFEESTYFILLFNF
jgi:hypothetical protein